MSKLKYTEKIVDDLVIRDIQFYNTIKLSKVIQIEKPDVIIILTLSFIFDRTIINIAKSNNIKTVFLAHGKLIDIDSAERAEKELNLVIWKKLSRIFRKKNLYVLLNYYYSLPHKNKLIIILKRIISIFRSPANFLTFPKFTHELDADLLLLYTQEDKELYTKTFHFSSEKIKVVGNPEVSSFINNSIISKEQYLEGINVSHIHNYVLYLDDGLVAGKIWTNTEWYNFILDINKILTDNNYSLIIKLHPRTNYEEHLNFFENNRIIALVDVDFNNLIYHSSSVVSHYSTTITYALIYNKLVLSPRWGISNHFPLNYPSDIVSYCYLKDDFLEKIKFPLINSDKIEEYLKLNGIDINIDSVKLIVNEVSKQIYI